MPPRRRRCGSALTGLPAAHLILHSSIRQHQRRARGPPDNRILPRDAAPTRGGYCTRSYGVVHMSDLRVGFIGLGNVGGPLAGNLLRDGIELTVRDLDP